MQLHPFLATVNRPVYWDRAGFLYLLVDCPDCHGEGWTPYSSINPSEKDGYRRCECCGGSGDVYTEVSEDDL